MYWTGKSGGTLRVRRYTAPKLLCPAYYRVTCHKLSAKLVVTQWVPNALVLNRSASSALTRVGRVRDCDVWSRSGYGRWNREGNSSTTALTDTTGTSAVQLSPRIFVTVTYLPLDTSLGHKAIPHNPNGERARRIARPRGERLDTGLSLDLHRRCRHPNAHRLIAT